MESDATQILIPPYAYIKPDPQDDGGLTSEYPIGFTGQGCIWYASTAPAGWLICDGSLVNKVDYPKLWALLADTWGTSTATQFYLPDLRQRVPVGKHSTGTFNDLNDSGGAETISTAHQHLLPMGWDNANWYGHGTSAILPIYGSTTTTAATRSMTPVSSNTANAAVRQAYSQSNNASPFGILQPYRVVNFIIKT